MIVVELINYYVDYIDKTVEVNFKTDLDSDDEFRSDKIFFFDIEELGYDIISERESILNYEEFDDDINEPENEIDEPLFIDFLNDYYHSYPDKIPKSEF